MDLVKRIRNISVLLAIFLFVNNTVSAYLYKDVEDYLVNVLVSIIIIGFSFCKRLKYFSYAYFIVAILVSLFGNDDNFAAIFLVIIACYLNKNIAFYIISLSSLLISSIIRYGFMQFDIPPFINMIQAYIYFGILCYSLFWKGVIFINNSKKHRFTPEQWDTVQTLLMDMRHQEAADQLYIERKTFTARVAHLRKLYDVKTDFHLALKLIDDGVITVNDLANAKTLPKKL